MEPSSPGQAGISDVQRLRLALGVPELSWLVDRIRTRLERGEPLDGTVTLVGASADQRRAAGRLLGHSPGRATALSISLPELEAVLRRTRVAPSLRAAVEALSGPVRDAAAERATEVQRWHDTLEQARRSRLAADSWYLLWLDEISRDGTITRLLRQGQAGQLHQAITVLEHLPETEEPAVMRAAQDEPPAVLLTELARVSVGDDSALSGTPLAALVLRALARREGVPAPQGARAERELWTLAGVVTDDLASQVLLLNVRAGGEPLGRWMTEAAKAGEPFRITLHQLTVMPVVPLPIDIYVCENSAVLRTAAARFGPESAALVCTEGEPSVACFRLLQAAVATGTRVHWHSDFDWPGLRATDAAIRRLSAEPWLMSADDYRAAMSSGRSEPLRGPEVPSPWDRRLSEAMRVSGRGVTEHRMLPDLLASLGPWRA
jgi:uncharacterized protein (TIGR02679 family)